MRGIERRTMGCVWMLVVVLFTTACGCLGGKIDVHTHYIPPFYRELVQTLQLSPGGMRTPPWSVKAHLDFMDRNGIDYSISCLPLPGPKLFEDTEDLKKFVRRINEYAHEMVKANSDRFQFFATLPLPDVSKAVDEAKYALDELNAAGILMVGNTDGVYIGDPKLDAIMEALNERNATVFVHPTDLPGHSGKDDLGLPSFVLDFEMDLARAALNILRYDIPGRFPYINFIFSHGGALLPYGGSRLAGTLSSIVGNPGLRMKMYGQMQNFYYDLSTIFSDPQFLALQAFTPESHILYASDFPFFYAADIITGIYDSHPPFKSNPALKEMIDYKNSATLFAKTIPASLNSESNVLSETPSLKTVPMTE